MHKNLFNLSVMALYRVKIDILSLHLLSISCCGMFYLRV